MSKDSFADIMREGGTAFPSETPSSHGGTIQWHGMTLRDYLAGQALAGIMAGHNASHGQVGWQANASWDAYSVADVMLHRRLEKDGAS